MLNVSLSTHQWKIQQGKQTLVKIGPVVLKTDEEGGGSHHV